MLLFGAGLGNAGAHDFGQAVNVRRGDAELVLDFPAHFLGPRFGAENAEAEGQVLDVDPDFEARVMEMQGVGRRTAEHGRAEVAHELDLTLGRAAGHGDDGRAEAFRAVVCAEAAGEQAVAVGNLHDVIGGGSGRGQRAGGAFGPRFNIALGVSYHGGLAGGSAGGMDALDHFHRDGEQPVRVVVPHVLLQGKGKEFQIVQRLHVGGLDALFVEAAAIEGNVGVNATAQVLKATQLDFPNLFPWHRLFIYVENHTVLQTECVKSRHTRIAPFARSGQEPKKGILPCPSVVSGPRRGQGFRCDQPENGVCLGDGTT